MLITSTSAIATPWSTLARHVVTAGGVEHEDLRVDEAGAEHGGQVVAARFDEREVDRAAGRVETHLELLDRVEVRGDVVTDGRVRAASGLDRDDPLLGQHPGAAEGLGVLGGEDVVRDHGERQVVAQQLTQRTDEGGLAAADRTADADPQRSLTGARLRRVLVRAVGMRVRRM